MGRCTPDEGSQYDVFVAEGCIPEKDYVSEMQDVTSRTSKQVKIYLRRKAEYYISVERKDTAVSGGNCTYGMTAGSIESRTTSRCFDFRRLSETDVVKVPNCRDVMPVFTGAVLPDTSTQATFIIALVGVGVLSIALIVLAFILIKRFRKRMHAAEEKKAKNKQVDDLEKIGIQDAPSARAVAEITPTKDIIGTSGKKQRHKLTERMKGLEQVVNRTGCVCVCVCVYVCVCVWVCMCARVCAARIFALPKGLRRFFQHVSDDFLFAGRGRSR